MKPINEAWVRLRHDQAMDFCDDALAARSRGDDARATDLFRQAFLGEKEAAEIVARNTALEPTRSVLLRSAASFAMECGERREAEKLIATALAGDPPDEIAEELRDLLERVRRPISERPLYTPPGGL